MEIRSLWQNVMGRLEGRLSAEERACWIAVLHPRELRDGRFSVEVPSQLHLECIRERFAGAIEAALGEELGAPTEISLTIRNGRNGHSGGARPRPPRSPFPAAYTFESFVTGPSNEIAYKSAREVASRPGDRFNPLFLWGGVGLGKTHLATAIANGVSLPARRVVLLSAELFTNEWIRALRAGRMETFRARFRETEVLIVDDIQFLAGKVRLQEEFFHTFNGLHGAGKQIVLASDHPPRDIPNLERRLRDRFECGLITDIRLPDVALRRAILERKAKNLTAEVPAQVLDLVAARVSSSVRELEGALQRLSAAAELTGRSLDTALALRLLEPMVRAAPALTVERVQRLVAAELRVRPEDLVCRRRSNRVVMPRQVAMYLARTKTGATYAEIAEGFGGRNHSTVMHAVKTVEERRRKEPEFAVLLERIEASLQALAGADS